MESDMYLWPGFYVLYMPMCGVSKGARCKSGVAGGMINSVAEIHNGPCGSYGSQMISLQVRCCELRAVPRLRHHG